ARRAGLTARVGALVVARSVLDRRLGELEHLGDVLFMSRGRLAQAVNDFERRHRDQQLPVRADREAADQATARHRSVSELFAELEFDRYDDFALFARGVAEIASDIA